MRNVIIGIIIIVLIALGWFFFGSKQFSTSLPGTSTGNVFTSIKDAMSKSLSLDCSFTDEQGRKTKSYIKNGAVRTDFTGKNPDESGSVIVKDKKMYSWNDAKKEGVMMKLSDEMQKNATAQKSIPDNAKSNQVEGQNIMETLEKYKKSCKPSVVSDSLFTPPSDVKFTDLSKVMQNLMVPTGSQNTPQFDQSQVEKMMQQYQQTPDQ